MGSLAADRRLPCATERMTLGGSGLEIGPLCLGAVRSPDVIPAAFDAGVNFFFLTTDLHWPLYEAAREGLRRLLARGGGIRDRLVIAATSYITQPEFFRAPFTELLEVTPELERLDVLVAGGAYADDALTRIGVLGDAVADRWLGARAVGISFHDRVAAGLIARGGLADVCFVRYNPAHPGARVDLFPQLARRAPGCRVFSFTSTRGIPSAAQLDALGIGDDVWRPRIEDGYRFALSRPELDGLLVAPGSLDELARMRAALDEEPLTDDEQDSMVTLYGMARGHG
jgi:hypothetical protein